MQKIIVYDFDGTLTPFPFPKLEILEKCGFKNGTANQEFLMMVIQRAKEKNEDLYVALYETFFEIIKSKGYRLIDETLCLGYDNVIYNDGVIEFLKYLKDYNIKNYLLSSGIKAFLDKISISSLFDSIFATTFYYNENKEVTGVDYLMSDKNKVSAIKNINENLGITPNDCSNIIYIGDGLTDLYAMEFVKSNGGISIFVYQDENDKDLKTIKEANVVTLFLERDFSLNGELMHNIMDLLEDRS